MVDVFSPSETQLLAVLALGLARVLLLRLTVVAALALVLRGSRPSERPVLLDSFAEYLRCVSTTPRIRRRTPQGTGRR
jgi:hypothetical protein